MTLQEAATIITVAVNGAGWMIKASAKGYGHRAIGGDLVWKPGLPPGTNPEEIAQLLSKEKNRQMHAVDRAAANYLERSGKP